ncbi:MAG TPA: POTRA domain-containing protein [Thermoanaerobaculia bacterium]
MNKAILSLLLIILAAPLFADEGPAFLIERIEVRNLRRVSADIIESETRLREGRTYSERELREASDRLNRLPFVLDAQFALEKGSVRDAYVLVVNVVETLPFFYLLDVTFLHEGGANVATPPDNSSAAGFRWFVGRRGVVHVGAFARDDDRPYTEDFVSLEAGYTQYDLFGTRAFASIGIKHSGVGGSISPEVIIGAPVTPTQTITASYSSLEMRNVFPRSERLLTLRWSYNTTNDPFFPTEGVVLTAAPVAGWIDDVHNRGTIIMPGPSGPIYIADRVTQHQQLGAFEASAARYFPLSERNSLAVEAEGGAGKAKIEEPDRHFEQEFKYGSASVRLSRRLRDQRSIGEAEQRLEFGVRAFVGDHEPLEYYQYRQRREDNDAYAAVNWVRRDTWGTLRLGMGYEW